MIVVWVLFGVIVIAAVGRWAWRFQMRALHLAGSGLLHMAGQPGTLVDIELKAVLADHDDSVLIAFRPAGVKMNSRRPASTLVLGLRDDEVVALARLIRWQTSGAPLLLWRDPSGDTVELSQVQTGQTVRLPVRQTATGHKDPVNNSGRDLKGNPPPR